MNSLFQPWRWLGCVAAAVIVAGGGLLTVPTWAQPAIGQLTAPVETFPLRSEAGREVCLLGQRAPGGELVLVPDTCFFYGELHLADAVTPKFPGAELNQNKSWQKIEGFHGPGQRVIWPLWLKQPGEVKLQVYLQVPAGTRDCVWSVSLAGVTNEWSAVASDGLKPQPREVTFSVPAAGVYELGFALKNFTGSGGSLALREVQVTGSAVADAVLVRSRWRPAAIHGHFGSSELAAANKQSRLWVMEVRPLPCLDSMYAPITTPFGYFGSTFEPDHTSGGVNFSMWSYGAGKAEPPLTEQSHLLALGDPRAEFSRFDGEGHGVKPRGWNPFAGRQISSATLALRLDPGDVYDTYTGYIFDEPSQAWKLYAAGRKWHGAGRGAHENLLPGSFVEVPGPPDKQRTAQVQRGAEFRGWCRDDAGHWHAIDELSAGDLKADELVQKNYQVSADGWFRMSMGGLEQFRYATAKPVIKATTAQPLPVYMQPAKLAALDQLPASVEVKDAQPHGGTVTLRVVVNTPAQATGKLTAYYGPTDAVTFESRWAHHLDLGELAPGEHVIQLPTAETTGACRLLLQGSFGSVWSYETTTWK